MRTKRGRRKIALSLTRDPVREEPQTPTASSSIWGDRGERSLVENQSLARITRREATGNGLSARRHDPSDAGIVRRTRILPNLPVDLEGENTADAIAEPGDDEPFLRATDGSREPFEHHRAPITFARSRNLACRDVADRNREMEGSDRHEHRLPVSPERS